MTGLGPKVLFRVDATADLGFGHLQRCLSLAAALRHAGARCSFALGLTSGEAIGRVERERFQWQRISHSQPWSVAEARHLRTALAGADAIVIDSRLKAAGYVSEVGTAGAYVVAIEDRPRVRSAADLLVCALDRQQKAAVAHHGSLLGPRFALLRSEFRDPARRNPARAPHNVVIALGGADRLRLMPRLIRALDQLPAPFRITAVVGPFFSTHRRDLPTSRKRAVRFVHAPTRVSHLFAAADVAISGAGQTLYELAATGTPTVAIKVARDQARQLRAFTRGGVVLSAGDGGADTVIVRVLRHTQKLLADARLRTTLSRRGPRLVDGRGADRVAAVIVDRLRVRAMQ